MPYRDLYHGAEAHKLLFNIRNGSLTANQHGELFFAEQKWEDCFVHGADKRLGESYVAKFRVEIPDKATLARRATSGNLDTRVLRLKPGQQVRAEVLELHVRRGLAGSFEGETIPQGRVQAYLENKVASVGNKAPLVTTAIPDEPPPVKTQVPDGLPPLEPEVPMPKPGPGRMYLDAAKAGFKAGLKGLLSAESIVGVAADLLLAVADKVATREAVRRIEIKFIKEGFAKGVAAGVMGWTEEEVTLNAMNRVTNFRVQGLGDPAGVLKLGYILKLAEVYENYAVGVGYYFSYTKSLQWKGDMRTKGFTRLKQYGYSYFGQDPDVLFEYDFIAKLAWALRGITDSIVEPAIRFGK